MRSYAPPAARRRPTPVPTTTAPESPSSRPTRFGGRAAGGSGSAGAAARTARATSSFTARQRTQKFVATCVHQYEFPRRVGGGACRVHCSLPMRRLMVVALFGAVACGPGGGVCRDTKGEGGLFCVP